MKKRPLNSSGWILGDRFLVLIFTVVDTALVLLAWSYFQSLNELTSQSILSSPAKEETQVLTDLQKIAVLGSWNTFEKVRLEKVAHYLQFNLRPTPGNALYFFPETLPQRSLEKEFAMSELKPGIDALKRACEDQRETEVDRAYKQLESRVTNYELGVTAEASELSEEAQNFIKIYRDFAQIKRHMKNRRLPANSD